MVNGIILANLWILQILDIYLLQIKIFTKQEWALEVMFHYG